MDVELELSRLLHARDTAVPVADPVPAVHAGMRRRRRAQRLQVLASAAAVVLVSAAAFAVVHDRGGRGPQTPATRPPAVGGAVDVSDVAFVGEQGWAVGRIPCAQGECAVLLVSADGGSTWTRRAAHGLPVGCSSAACVDSVRFADTRVGYAFGHGLFVTSDAGRTWSQITTADVQALELSASTAYRVATAGAGCLPGCPYQVQSSPIGSVVWHTLTTVPGGTGVGLDVRGDRVLVTRYADRTGSQLVRSEDGGASWHADPDPCAPDSETRDIAVGPEATVVALCAPGSSEGPASTRVSVDGGRTYAPSRPLPTSSVERITVLTPDTAVAVVHEHGGVDTQVVRTTDAGRSWEVVTDVVDPSSVRIVPVRFWTSTRGSWVAADGRSVHLTQDGGRTWSVVRFAS
jgi:photosystem II stability/assembly factor-like uncharacterized protein